ncbi:MAG: glycoside hydrolase family 127 protein [Bacteroidales bacterium]|nr:glycoside hydrolase family 127 protein [Bacteroidales bacterium]
MKIHFLTFFLLLAGVSAWAQDGLYKNEFPLGDVTLLDGVLKDASDLNIKTLLQYDCDRLLAPIRKEAGLEPKAPLYPNWEGLDGHVAGHYLSAMAMNAATGDEECQRRMDYMLSELEECLEANNENNASWGMNYMGGMPNSAKIWTDFMKGEFGPYFGAWAPFYNLHKMFAGLRDAWLYCGRENAKDLFLKYCDWAIFLTKDLSDEQMEAMLGNEHGGMDEVLADAYAISGDSKYLECAKRFSHKFLLDPMAEHVDMLDNLHANTQVPKAVGFERIYQLGGGEKFHDASLFFWETVTSNRTLAFGGNSRREHFPTKETSIDYVNDIDGAESCNTYNMLKLTEDLFRTSPEQRFAEYYERAAFNHILSTQHPEHGGYVYFTSARPRHYRNYSAPNEAMWCCVGTGMENHGKYGQFIYTKTDDALYINLFVASELEWKDRGMTIRQETSFPYSESSTITVTRGKGNFKMMLRYPTWVKPDGYSITVNGKPIAVSCPCGSYVCVDRKWKKGDVVKVEFPMANRVEHLPNVPQYIALMHGPILLAMKTGTEDLKHLVADDSRFGQYADGEKLPIDKAPFFVADDVEKIADEIVPIEGKPLHFTIKTHMENPIEGELQPFFEIHDARYMMYWLALDKDGYQQYIADLAKAEAEREALEKRTVDKVQPGEQQPETDHRMESNGSRPGNTNGVFFRDARNGGSFSYLMQTAGETGLSVMVKYWGQDEWKTCEYDLYADDAPVCSVNNTKKWRTSQWKTESYPIPASVLEGKTEVRIKFVAKPGKQVGEIYEVRLVRDAER